MLQQGHFGGRIVKDAVSSNFLVSSMPACGVLVNRQACLSQALRQSGEVSSEVFIRVNGSGSVDIAQLLTFRQFEHWQVMPAD